AALAEEEALMTAGGIRNTRRQAETKVRVRRDRCFQRCGGLAIECECKIRLACAVTVQGGFAQRQSVCKMSAEHGGPSLVISSQNQRIQDDRPYRSGIAAALVG